MMRLAIAETKDGCYPNMSERLSVLDGTVLRVEIPPLSINSVVLAATSLLLKKCRTRDLALRTSKEGVLLLIMALRMAERSMLQFGNPRDENVLARRYLGPDDPEDIDPAEVAAFASRSVILILYEVVGRNAALDEEAKDDIGWLGLMLCGFLPGHDMLETYLLAEAVRLDAVNLRSGLKSRRIKYMRAGERAH